ncbi:hypothetical protein HPP92_016819 [Vanilla planifolia]|uniref:Uncharacterized protein n=1 Tax=Vanilla planifolia TaxID=51239 RepID=A0A835QIU4_VANPL|nr:hypothetical protein HPP92_017404 [Vanilla planifolia]KAG0472273.1 hypothetical protein HPP92_016819 [Vanilla planifolia]
MTSQLQIDQDRITGMGLILLYSIDLHYARLKHSEEVKKAIALIVQTLQIMLDCRTRAKFAFIHGSMDQLRSESIKSIMLKHEEIFKQQVLELHRLYRVQKFLMAELSGKKVKMNSIVANPKTLIAAETTNKFQNSASCLETSYSSHVTARKQPIALPTFKCTKIAGFAAMTTGNKSVNLNNCSEEPLGTSKEECLGLCSVDDCNLDLTLSIGCGSEKKKMGDWKQITNESTQLLS